MKKRISTTVSKNIDNTINININCKKCGKPITESNDYGMYCENYCGQDEDIKAYEKIKKIMPFFTKGFK